MMLSLINDYGVERGIILESIETREDEQEIEIDLKALFLKVKSLWYVVLIGMLVGALATAIYSGFLKTPMYESSSMVYLRNASKNVSLQDLQLGSELTNDYEIIFKSRPNMEKVIQKLGLDYDVQTLSKMISITNLNDSRILKIKVVSDNPNLASDIANEVANCGIDNVREIDSQEPFVIETAIANKDKIGASTFKMTIIGAFAGIIFALGGIFVQFILSDNIQSVEDVENTLGLPVLAVVVEDKALSYVKKKTAAKGKGRL